jgi:hypothetical protein
MGRCQFFCPRVSPHWLTGAVAEPPGQWLLACPPLAASYAPRRISRHSPARLWTHTKKRGPTSWVAGDLSILRGRESYGRALGDSRRAPSPTTHRPSVRSTALPFSTPPARGCGHRHNLFSLHRLRRSSSPSWRLLSARSVGPRPPPAVRRGPQWGTRAQSDLASRRVLRRISQVDLEKGIQLLTRGRPNYSPRHIQLLIPAHPGGIFSRPFRGRDLKRPGCLRSRSPVLTPRDLRRKMRLRSHAPVPHTPAARSPVDNPDDPIRIRRLLDARLPGGRHRGRRGLPVGRVCRRTSWGSNAWVKAPGRAPGASARRRV